jgi:hypothetical protein
MDQVRLQDQNYRDLRCLQPHAMGCKNFGMQWREVADLDVLHQGDTLQSMGSKEIMVGHGHHSMLVGMAYGSSILEL